MIRYGILSRLLFQYNCRLLTEFKMQVATSQNVMHPVDQATFTAIIFRHQFFLFQVVMQMAVYTQVY